MCDADHCQCAIGAAACKTCGTRMQAGEKVTVTPKQVFVKVILPKWLNELYSLLRPVAPNAGDVVDSTAEGTAGSAAAGEAANEPPRKKLKSKGEYKQLAQERRVALAGLTSELSKPCEIREHASRWSVQAPFKWFQTATTKAEKDAALIQWQQAGHGDKFALFHTGSNRPLQTTECAAILTLRYQ